MAARQDHPYLELLKRVFTDADQDFLLEQCYKFDETPIEDLILNISEINYPKNETQQTELYYAPGPSNCQCIHNPGHLIARLPRVGNKGVRLSVKIETINIDSDDESDLEVLDMIVSPSEISKRKHEEFLRLYRSLAEQITIEDFLEMYPDPSAYFDVLEFQYKQDVSFDLAYLRARYSCLSKDEIGMALRHYQTLKKVCEELDTIERHHRPCEHSWGGDHLLEKIWYPLLHEMFYVENYEMIQRTIVTAEDDSITEVENVECPICCEDNLKLEDMIRYIESAIGEGKINFVCFEVGCEAEFSMEIVKIVLDEGLFSKLVTRRVVEDVKAANLEGLESCPFCDYMAINPMSWNIIFHCANPNCGKYSCITNSYSKCKKECHYPWPCVKDKQTQLRTEIENKMTEALVSCPLFTKDEEYMGAVRQAGEKAKTEVMRQNPGVTLSHDPTASPNHC
uniref:RING-type domain-containing protein n=1 Tax=Timema tahoe TaxID=61484 RepID=A0A7R9FKD6_9NEOP|nr:unnamed protein product [Timema tahoe]